MLSLYVIGCGGIGGHLLSHLLESLASLDLDMLEKFMKPAEFTRHLENFGKEVTPSIVDRIVLVDGDEYSPRNALRQGHAAGSKMEICMSELDHSAIRQTYFRLTDLVGVNCYINPDNMAKIIPRCQARNNANDGGCLADRPSHFSNMLRETWPGTRDMPVIFLCVDNVKTRYEISKYAESFDNILVINGGNEKTSGHVTVYERRDGLALDPNLPDVYPDVKADADLRPDEQDTCTHIAPKHDQVSDTNELIAIYMRRFFNRWLMKGLSSYGPKGQDRFNEILIDLESMTTMPVYHPPRT